MPTSADPVPKAESATTDAEGPRDAPGRVDKSERRVRRMFGEIAARYDLLNRLLSGGVDRWWRRQAIRASRPTPASRVLDVCTGTGDLALAYRRAGAGLVVGADFTHEMLRIAEQKRPSKPEPPTAAESSAAGLHFVEADAQALPFASDRFDVVSVAFGLRNVTDTDRGLREMVRVCAPGGRVVILEFGLPTNRLFRAVYLWYFRHVLPRIGQLLARNRQAAYEYLPQSVSQFPYGEELATKLRTAGLTAVVHRPLTFGIAVLYVGRKGREPEAEPEPRPTAKGEVPTTDV